MQTCTNKFSFKKDVWAFIVFMILRQKMLNEIRKVTSKYARKAHNAAKTGK